MTPHTYNQNTKSSQRKTMITRRTKNNHTALARRERGDFGKGTTIEVNGKTRGFSVSKMKRHKLIAERIAKSQDRKAIERLRLGVITIADIPDTQASISAVDQQKIAAEILEDGPEDKYEFLARFFDEDF